MTYNGASSAPLMLSRGAVPVALGVPGDLPSAFVPPRCSQRVKAFLLGSCSRVNFPQMPRSSFELVVRCPGSFLAVALN